MNNVGLTPISYVSYIIPLRSPCKFLNFRLSCIVDHRLPNCRIPHVQENTNMNGLLSIKSNSRVILLHILLVQRRLLLHENCVLGWMMNWRAQSMQYVWWTWGKLCSPSLCLPQEQLSNKVCFWSRFSDKFNYGGCIVVLVIFFA